VPHATPSSDHLSRSTSVELREYSCSLCNSTDYQVRFEASGDAEEITPDAFACTTLAHRSHFRIVVCAQCGMTYCSPRPTPHTLHHLYSQVRDEVYLDHVDARERTFCEASQRIGRRGGALLDIGCGTGIFLRVARTLGFDVRGVEPSDHAATHAREHEGLEVRTGSFPCDGFDPVDVITLWDVIEHVHDPREVLRGAFRILKPGGELHLSTMRVDALFPRVMGERWPWYMTMHLHYFSRRTIRLMLEESGFTGVEIFPYAHYVHRRYLERKRRGLALPIRLGTYAAQWVWSDKEGFVRVYVGDLMHVRAVRPPENS
jgi:SAM-dependent methyltransferase